MSAESGYPKGWSNYIKTQKSAGQGPDKKFANFAARFRASKKYTAICLEGMSQTAEQGYFLGLKLTLIDSALESFESATGKKPGSLEVFDANIALELWRIRKSELQVFHDLLDNKQLKVDLSLFLKSNSKNAQDFNLRTIVRGFRHITAHGPFTPSSVRVYTSKNYQSLLLRLGEISLEACDEAFVESTTKN